MARRAAERIAIVLIIVSISYRLLELLLAATTYSWIIQQVSARRAPAIRPG